MRAINYRNIPRIDDDDLPLEVPYDKLRVSPDLGMSKTEPHGWRKISCTFCHTAFSVSIFRTYIDCPFCYRSIR